MSNKIKLLLAPVNGGPFNCAPAQEIEIERERVLCNDVVLPWERHPHGMSLWVVCSPYGALGAVWAGYEQEALDALVDAGLGDALLVSEADQAAADEDEREEWAHPGNAGEPCDLTDIYVRRVDLAKLPPETLCAFAEARGEGAETLDR